MKRNPSEYEIQAIRRIHEWKDPELTALERGLEFVNLPLQKISKLASKIPGADWAIERSIGELMGLMNDVAQWSVRPEAIYADYRRAGYKINERAQIFELDLSDVDRVIGRLAPKYEAVAAGEGAVTGVAGVLGVPTDVAALAGLMLRAAGEYAVYCGFDVRDQQERLFIMNVMNLAASPNASAKQRALSQLVRIARDVAGRRARKNIEKSAFTKIIDNVSRSLGSRLTRDKMAQFLPVVGALAGGATNAWYAARVCRAARNLYRERFLAQKYGEDWIEITVQPAQDPYPDYQD